MCGFFGGMFESAQLSQDRFQNHLFAIKERLSRRGPDGEGEARINDTNILFVHKRLTIQDLSEDGNQPMVSESGRYCLIFNGEIYNFRELALSVLGIDKFDKGDTRLISMLLDKIGFQSAIKKMRGMIAIAVYDSLEEKIFLFKDFFGEKPLFYSSSEAGFVFGSLADAVATIANDGDVRINSSSAQRFFKYGYVSGDESIFSGVKRLAPGVVLSFNCKRGVVESQIKINTNTQDFPKKKTFTQKEVVTETERLLLSAVESTVVADVPVGTFLSGGIDSSLISLMADEITDGSLPSFTLGFSDNQFDETPFATAVADYRGLDHMVLRVGVEELASMIFEIPKIYDEPFADSSQIATAIISKFASQHVKVVIGGDGADEIFGGYDRYRIGEKILSVRQTIPQFAISACSTALRSVAEFIGSRSIRAFEYEINSSKVRRLSNILGARTSSELYERIIELSNEEIIHSLGNGYWTGCELDEAIDFQSAAKAFDREHYLPNDIFVKVDRASMFSSLEVRTPFTNLELVEWVDWICPKKPELFQGKKILKEILLKRLPSRYFDRPKKGFGVPVNALLLGPLASELTRLIDTHRDSLDWLVNFEIIRKLISRHRSGEYYLTPQIWAVFTFFLWIENRQR